MLQWEKLEIFSSHINIIEKYNNLSVGWRQLNQPDFVVVYEQPALREEVKQNDKLRIAQKCTLYPNCNCVSVLFHYKIGRFDLSNISVGLS